MLMLLCDILKMYVFNWPSILLRWSAPTLVLEIHSFIVSRAHGVCLFCVFFLYVNLRFVFNLVFLNNAPLGVYIFTQLNWSVHLCCWFHSTNLENKVSNVFFCKHRLRDSESSHTHTVHACEVFNWQFIKIISETELEKSEFFDQIKRNLSKNHSKCVMWW